MFLEVNRVRGMLITRIVDFGPLLAVDGGMRGRTGFLTAAIAAGTGYGALSYLLRRRSRIEVRDKVVLITGGSRGLGLATAREFGARGAIVAICARKRAELERAEADLKQRGIRAYAFVCDVTDREEVARRFEETARQLGPIDILVNNAGIIQAGPFAAMDVEDFEQAMKVMFWGSLYTTLAVLPAMRERKQGSIVNVTSIGGKVSVPHLLPYCCAKFAAVALSEGLRTELAHQGIRVTTIAPGLLRTGSHLKAQFKGKHADEYAWFALAAATPVVSIGVERAARSIVRSTEDGKGEAILSLPANVLARIHGMSPNLSGALLSFANGVLPRADGNSQGMRTGEDIEREFHAPLWKAITGPGQRAGETLNEESF